MLYSDRTDLTMSLGMSNSVQLLRLVKMTFAESKAKTISARQSDCGFSLIELLIALTILLILAAMAVPSYMAARARANEASAASSVRAIISAQNLYRNTFGFFTSLNNLGQDYLTDNLLAAGSKSGYVFSATPGTSPSLEFAVDATPILSIGPSATGSRAFYGDESAIIRFSLTGAADSTSPPIQ
jgi:prepilin-type N-terminal cleavage/methylation domain-containing protein